MKLRLRWVAFGAGSTMIAQTVAAQAAGMGSVEISWDTVQSIALGVLGAGWIALAGFLGGIRADLNLLKAKHVTPEEIERIVEDVETIKRVVYLIADRVGVPNASLNR